MPAGLIVGISRVMIGIRETWVIVRCRSTCYVRNATCYLLGNGSWMSVASWNKLNGIVREGRTSVTSSNMYRGGLSTPIRAGWWHYCIYIVRTEGCN